MRAYKAEKLAKGNKISYEITQFLYIHLKMFRICNGSIKKPWRIDKYDWA